MDNILATVKDKIEEVVAQIKGDDGALAKFKENPIDTVKELLGKIDLPDGALDNIVDTIKEKLGIGGADNAADDGNESIGEKITDAVGDLLGKAKDIFGKKED